MVSFREHFLLIIEPEHFNIHKACTDYSTLGFIIGSSSPHFHTYLIDIISEHIELWHSQYTLGILKETKSDIIQLLHHSIRKNRISIQTICTLGILVYYIAASQHSNVFLRYFTLPINESPIYYTYIGVHDHSPDELVTKIFLSITLYPHEDKRLLFFIHTKDVQEYKKSKRSKQLNTAIS